METEINHQFNITNKNLSLLELKNYRIQYNNPIKNEHIVLYGSDEDSMHIFNKYHKKLDMIFLSVEDLLKFSQISQLELNKNSSLYQMLYQKISFAKYSLSSIGTFVLHVKDKNALGFRELLSQIFGSENYVTTFIWDNMHKSNNIHQKISNTIEYFYVFAKDISNFQVQQKKISVKDDSSYNLEDSFVETRGKYKLVRLDTKSFEFTEDRGKPIVLNNMLCFAGGSEAETRKKIWTWSWDSETIRDRFEKGHVVIQKDNRLNPRIYKKQYQFVDDDGEPIVRKVNYNNIIHNITNISTKKEFESATKTQKASDIIPIDVFKHIVKALTNQNASVLNLSTFYGTLSASIMELNYNENTSRICYSASPDIVSEKDYLNLLEKAKLITPKPKKKTDLHLWEDSVRKVIDSPAYEKLINSTVYLKHTPCFKNVVTYLTGKNPLSLPRTTKNINFIDASLIVFKITENTKEMDMFDLTDDDKNKIESSITFDNECFSIYLVNDTETETKVLFNSEQAFVLSYALFKTDKLMEILHQYEHTKYKNKPSYLIVHNSLICDSKIDSLGFIKIPIAKYI